MPVTLMTLGARESPSWLPAVLSHKGISCHQVKPRTSLVIHEAVAEGTVQKCKSQGSVQKKCIMYSRTGCTPATAAKEVQEVTFDLFHQFPSAQHTPLRMVEEHAGDSNTQT